MELVWKIILFTLTVLYMIVCLMSIIKFCKYKNTPGIRSLAPKLLFISILMNFLSTCMLISGLAFYESKDTIFYLTLGSELICIPVMYAAYVFRLMEYNGIFIVSSDISENSNTRSTFLKQKIYCILLLIIFVLLTTCGGVLGYIYLFHEKDKKYRDVAYIILLMSTIITSFLGQFFYSVSGIRKLTTKQFLPGINKEIVIFVIIWPISSAVYYLCEEKYKMDSNNIYQLGIIFTLIVRNLVTFFISFVLPLLKNLEEEAFPQDIDSDCAEKLEGALSNELSNQYFAEFLKTFASIEGMHAYNLHAKIKLYESEVMVNTNSATKIAIGIRNDYLAENAEIQIEEITDKTKDLILKKFTDLESNLDVHLFDLLFGVTINKLVEYFDLFKQSEPYKCLCWELRNRKIIAKRLAYSGLS